MAKLTRSDVIRLNKQLRAQGKRYCADCEGTYALTDEHWYFAERARDGYGPSAYCKRCTNARVVDTKRRWRAKQAWRKARM